MNFLEIYTGIFIVLLPVMLILLKISPIGWQDENGFHQENEKEELITFPLKKKVASSNLSINSKLAPYHNLNTRTSGYQITLGL